MITLTKEQQLAVEVFNKFLNSDENYMTLMGYAGTGKSTVVDKLLSSYPYPDKVAITAPTHKALKVLIDKTNNFNYADARTIHSVLGLKLVKRNHKEVLEKDFNTQNSVIDYKLIIIDEASMVGEDLFNYLNMEVANTNIKVLFVGDPLQLPPVNEKISPVFEVPEYMVKLTEVVRQATDNPIINLTVQIREAIKIKDEDSIDFKTSIKDDLGIKLYHRKKEFKEAILSHVKTINDNQERNLSGFNPEEVDTYKVISWRNSEVKRYNNFIRKELDYSEEEFSIDELVTLNNSFFKEGVTIPRDTYAVITQVDHVDVDKYKLITKVPIEAYELTLYIPDVGKTLTVKCVKKSSQLVLNNALRYLAEIKNWKMYWVIKEYFSDIRHIHSITSHKSQGSTYETAFVNADDILSNINVVEGLKCLYVAVSRASKNVHIYIR